MNKLISMFVLAIFLVSAVPFAFAQENASADERTVEPTDTTADGGDISDEESVDEREETEIRIRDDGEIRIRERFRNATEEIEIRIREDDGEIRIRERFRNATLERRERFEELRLEQIEKYKDLTREERKRFRELRADEIEKFKRFTQEELKKFAALGRARIKEFKDLDESEIKERLGKFRIKIVKKEELFKKRVIAETKLKEAREEYREAKKEFIAAKKRYGEKKAELQRVRQRIRECEPRESEECQQLQTEALQNAQDYVVSFADSVVNHLERIKAKVEEAESLTEAEAREILADLDTGIGKLNALIDEAKAATTKKELKDVARRIDRIWKHFKVRAVKHADTLVSSRIGEIIKRSQRLEDKLDRILSRMEERGVDTGGLDEKLADFSEKIDEARDKFAEAQGKLADAKKIGLLTLEPSETEEPTPADLADARALLEEAKKLNKEAHQLLSEAHRILKDILQDLRSRGAEVDLEEEEEVEVIEEIEEEEAEEEADEEEADEEEADEEETPVNVTVEPADEPSLNETEEPAVTPVPTTKTPPNATSEGNATEA